MTVTERPTPSLELDKLHHEVMAMLTRVEQVLSRGQKTLTAYHKRMDSEYVESAKRLGDEKDILFWLGDDDVEAILERVCELLRALHPDDRSLP